MYLRIGLITNYYYYDTISISNTCQIKLNYVPLFKLLRLIVESE